MQQNNLIERTKAVNEENYFELINNINLASSINNYEKLDNLLWLIGKLSKVSYSILMNKAKYLKLIESEEIKIELQKPENKMSSAKNEVFRNYIKKTL